MTLNRSTSGLLNVEDWTGSDNSMPADFDTKVPNPNLAGHSITIVSNQLKGTNTQAGGAFQEKHAYENTNTAQGDQFVQCKVVSAPAANLAPGVMLRHDVPGYGGGMNNGYLAYCNQASSTDLWKCISNSYTQLATTSTKFSANDILGFAVIGTSPNIALSLYKNGSSLLSSTGQTNFASGRAGLRLETGSQASAIIDDWIRMTHYNLVVTGLPVGYYAKVSGVSGSAKAAASAGTATVDTRPVIYALTGGTLQIYNGDPDSGGSLVDSTTGVYGGDTWAYSAPTTFIPQIMKHHFIPALGVR